MALETLLVENRKNLFLKKPVFRGNSLDRKGKGKKEETKKMMKVRAQNRLLAKYS